MIMVLRKPYLLFGLLFFCFASFALTEETNFDAVRKYKALRAASANGGSLPASGQVLERDVHRLTFESGRFYFLEPIDGVVAGAVFEGKGRYTLKPSREHERRQLSLSSSGKYDETLTEPFETLLIWFTDDTFKQLCNGQTPASGDASPGERVLKKYRRILDKEFRTDLEMRVLEAMSNGGRSSEGLFLAVMDLPGLPPVIAGFDPLGADATRIFSTSLRFGAETSFFKVNEDRAIGYWFLDYPKDGPGGKGSYLHVDVTHYHIDMNIKGSQDFEASTRINFRVNNPALTLLPLYMAEGLTVDKAVITDEQGQSMGVEAAVIGDRRASVAFSKPLEKGKVYNLTLDYEAEEIMYDLGFGLYVVAERTSWYPNPAHFTDKAHFTLRFETAKDHKLIATAELKSSRVEGKRLITEWTTREPQTTAGFNYGIFEEMKDKDTGVDISVHRGRDMPDNLVANVLADTKNSLRLFSEYFGPLEYSHISVTQQAQSSFGQAWPTLVFLPYASFTSNTGYGRDASAFYGDLVTPHEVAHQWWGHHVTARTYRDQWLEEGLAQFSAGLLRELAGGSQAGLDFWEGERERIMERTRRAKVTSNDAGPISQGLRLITREAPRAYQVIAYSKGAYVVHMLRMMMRDRRNPDPIAADAAFKNMMRDFFQNRPGDTCGVDDFKAVVERHIPANLKYNGTMDYFFDQWVHGIQVPDYQTNITITDQGGGKYHMKGTITQTDVPDQFRMWVPLYMKFGKDRYQWFGTLPFAGNQTHHIDTVLPIPEKPKGVVANANYDVLTRSNALGKKGKKKKKKR